jgi:hypothetical protein
MHTIGDAIHTYVFGDKMGQLRVHCLSFDASCNGGADHGLVLADQWYEDNKLSATDTPVTAMIGRKVFSGLLLGSETEYADAENKMAQIVLNFALLEG